MPLLQIPIPNVKFQPAINCTSSGDENKLCVNWIAEYIAGIYKYAIGIVGILATVVMMIGGVMWIMSGGNQTTVGEAKAWITASLTGLIIALSSYMILYQVNPALVQLAGIKLPIVEPIPEEGDNSSRSISASDIDGINIPSGTVSEVVNNMIGKYTYSQEKRLTSADGNNYIDCSSFVCTVLEKSGQAGPSPAACTTAGLFTSSPQETNLADMPAGIVVGYPPSASTNSAGHAWISMGDGRFANARGGTEGRQPGNSITIVSASQVTTTMAKYGVSKPYIMTK
jgi:cell wall-associated NlpC family hydrolase